MLWDALTAPRNAAGHVTLVGSDGTHETDWAAVVQAGQRAASGLRDRGVVPGDRVGLVLTNSAEAIVALVGAWFAGATAVSLPVIARGMSVDAYIPQIARLCRHADARVLLVERSVLDVFSGSAPGCAVVSSEAIAAATGVADPSPPSDDAIAFVQFSSGTTGDPRGAALTAKAIAAQLAALAEAVAVDPGRDRAAAWLPLSHDMGLFGCLLLSWYTGTPLLLGTPQRFLASPRSWLDDCAQFGATLSAIQPSALRLASRAARTGPQASAKLMLRACLVGGERIPAQALDEASEILSGCGAAPTALTPAYGLAEATLAVSVAPVEEPPCTYAVDRDALWDGHVVEDPADNRAVHVVSCGRPLPGVSVAIDGTGPVGEILVDSPSLARGYLNDPAATAEAFGDGGLATSDLGFVRDGELYPLGRADDVLNVAGRRVNALEVEEELGRHPALRAGCCAIVEVADDERVRHIAVAELARARPADLSALAQELRRETLAQAGVPLDDCVFLERGRLPKTPSGKVRRFDARRLVTSPTPETVRVVLRD